MSLTATRTATIIGGGMVGVSCGLALLDRGFRVTIIDPDLEAERASFGNAGVISSGSIFPVAGPAVWKNVARYALGQDIALRLRYQDLAYLRPWLQQFLSHANTPARERVAAALAPFTAHALDHHLRLARQAQAGHLIHQQGWLRLYRSPDAFAGSIADRVLLDHHKVAYEILDADELADIEPSLHRRFQHAIWLTETASVSPPGALLNAYRQLFMRRHGIWLRGQAQRIVPTTEGVNVHLADQVIYGHYAVMASGVHSRTLAHSINYHPPIVAERGYHVHRTLHDSASLNRPIFDVEGSYVMSPMPEHSVRILSGVELAKPHSPPNYQQIQHVVNDARASIDITSESFEPSRCWLGSRPSTPDGLPVIGYAPRQQRVLMAFGHGHIGLSTGPITGELIAGLLNHENLPFSIDAFSPDRFR